MISSVFNSLPIGWIYSTYHSEGKPGAMVNKIYEKHAKCHLQNFP
jgi:hypothetical protein